MIPAIGTAGSRAVSFLGGSAARAGAAGAAGGMLLDDVPLIGGALDPTEGGDGGGMSVEMMAILGLAAVVVVLAVAE